MFLDEPEPDEGAQRLFDEDTDSMGWVMNVSRLWAWQPESQHALFDLLRSVSDGFSMRQRAVLVAACASTFGDSYCSMARGGKLRGFSPPEVIAAVDFGRPIAGDAPTA